MPTPGVTTPTLRSRCIRGALLTSVAVLGALAGGIDTAYADPAGIDPDAHIALAGIETPETTDTTPSRSAAIGVTPWWEQNGITTQGCPPPREIDNRTIAFDCVKHPGSIVSVDNPGRDNSLLRVSVQASRDIIIETFNLDDQVKIWPADIQHLARGVRSEWFDFGPNLDHHGTKLWIVAPPTRDDIRITVTVKSY
ncbi:hypothetical protein LQL77_29600 [Rhodococcus cerastii]|nr:hypothetical protein [Rhodococcus cerastii]